MGKVKEIRSLFNEIKTVRRELKAQLEEIAANDRISDIVKSEQREKIIEAAKMRLAEIQKQADETMPVWEQIAEQQNAFNYNDPRLLAAAQFIKLNGAKLPETAWRQMIDDYSTRPAELLYLADLFDSNGVVYAAAAAADVAKKTAYSASLPQRVSDKLYYMTQSVELNENEDCDGLDGELDALEQYETELEEKDAAKNKSESEVNKSE